MYAWKYWRETRARFLCYLVAPFALSSFLTFAAAFENQGKGWKYIPSSAPQRASEVWERATPLVALSGMWLAGLAAISLGASGVGEEFKQGTLEALLTRPRRRRYFVWVGWAVGISQILALIAGIVLTGFALLVILTRQVQSWRFLALLPGLFVGGAVLFSLAYFFTLLFREGRNGSSFAVFTLLVYWGISLYRLTHNHPELPALFKIVGPVLTGTGALPIVNWMGWLAFAIALIGLCQLIFDRADL